MKKSELVNNISIKKDISRIEAKKVVDNIIEKMSRSLSRGERIEIRNFGSFKVKTLKRRNLKNPRTGKMFIRNPKNVIRFKSSKYLKNMVKDLY